MLQADPQTHLVWSFTGAISLATQPHFSQAVRTTLAWSRLLQTRPEVICRELDAVGLRAEVLPMTFKVSCPVASLPTFPCVQHSDLIVLLAIPPPPQNRAQKSGGLTVTLHRSGEEFAGLSAGKLDPMQFQNGPAEGTHASIVKQLSVLPGKQEKGNGLEEGSESLRGSSQTREKQLRKCRVF